MLLRTVAVFGPETNGPSAVHSGNMGDIIYALPTCRALGVERLVLNLCADPGLSGRALSEGAARFLLPLLQAQPWLKRIELARVPIRLANGFGAEARAAPAAEGLPLDLMEPADLGVDYVLDRFRLQPLDRCHLIEAHAAAQDIVVDGDLPFLNVPPAGDTEQEPGPIVLSLTPRYRFLDTAFFADLLRGLPVVKVGSPSEAWTVAGIPGDFVTADDALELARLVGSARLFIGNPSLPYALAEGLKVPRLVDVPDFPLNAFPLGRDGWLLPTDPDRAAHLLRAVLDGRGEVDNSMPPVLSRPRPRRLGLRWRGDGEAFDEDRVLWTDTEHAGSTFRARLDISGPLSSCRALRIDLDGVARKSGEGLLITRLNLMNRVGDVRWSLTQKKPESTQAFTAAVDGGNLLAPPEVTPDGLLLSCGSPHVWFGIPLPEAVLQSLAAPFFLTVEGRRLDGALMARHLAEALAWRTEQVEASARREVEWSRQEAGTTARSHEQEEELAAATHEVRVLKEELAAATHEVQVLKEGQALIRRSLSWRITRPLRFTKALLTDPARAWAMVCALLARRTGTEPVPDGESALPAESVEAAETAEQVKPAEPAETAESVPPAPPSTSHPATSLPGVATPPTSWSMRDYDAYLARVEPQLQAVDIESLGRRPTVSLVVPVYNPDPEEFREMVASVRAQIYPEWELCLADDCSPDPRTRALLDDAAAADPRIKVVFREQNGHIAAATNSAIDLATGDFIGFLDQDDMLHPACLALVARYLNAHPATRIVYTDEDKLENGRRGSPYFKPNWSYTLFQAQNFLNHFTAVDTELVRTVGGLCSEFNGAQDFDFLYRCLERVHPDEIGHVPAVLYHWRANEGSIASSPEAKHYVFDAGRQGLRAHLERQGVSARVEEAFHFSVHRVHYPVPRSGSVSICIVGDDADPQPWRDWAAARPSLDVEILVAAQAVNRLDGVRQIPVAPPDSENAGINTPRRLAYMAHGEIVMMMSAALRPEGPEAVDELLTQALRPEIGCVGGSVVDDEERMRHAGLILDRETGVLLPYWGTPRHEDGSVCRLRLPHEVGAVAPFCLAMRRTTLLESLETATETSVLGAMLRVQARLRAAGLGILWTPHAVFRVTGDPLSMLLGNGLPEADRQRLGSALDDPIYHPALSRALLYEVAPAEPPGPAD